MPLAMVLAATLVGPRFERAQPALVLHGEASWYGEPQATASGERFDPNALTCAMRPPVRLGARVRVTHAGRSVVLRVNDRGPYARDRRGRLRVIDVSRAGAARLGLLDRGVGQVEAEVLR
jgi:rare lipoprotein A